MSSQVVLVFDAPTLPVMRVAADVDVLTADADYQAQYEVEVSIVEP